LNALVIDASVAAGLFFEEPHSEAIEGCLKQADDLLAPDLIWAEIANVIWKRHRRGEITEEDAAGIVAEVARLPIRCFDSHDLMSDALQLAMRYDRSIYDSLYVALAVRTRSVMITADKRLANAMAKTPLMKRVSWIGASR
jgi:predicted nucleic acid-binding protein